MAAPKRLTVLLLDDGELEDVQRILESSGAEFGRVRGGAIVPDTPPPRRLLISTPRRIQAVRSYRPDLDGEEEPTRVVVVDGDSHTLRARLREIGFDYIVRRPVHPEALRLLILRCLYNGAERRRDPRVPVGYEISFKTGLLTRKATLAEVSLGGCRLITTYALTPGKRIKLHLPEQVGASHPITLTGRVLRRELDPAQGQAGRYVAAVQFEDLDADIQSELARVIGERSRGPVALDGSVEPPRDPRIEPSSGRLLEVNRSPRPDPRSEPEPPPVATAEAAPAASAEAAPAPEPAAEAPSFGEIELPEGDEEGQFFQETPEDLQNVDLEVDLRMHSDVDPDADTRPYLDTAQAQVETQVSSEAPQADSNSERRRSRRAAFARKVPAFGNRALRVLVGRDLSKGGMRVERFPGLEIGDRLHLAIYGNADEEEPFLIWATVSRDDGPAGMALVFDPVHEITAQKLEALVTDLPAVESLRDGECGAMGTVVGEILES
jgi:hypothetical protein